MHATQPANKILRYAVVPSSKLDPIRWGNPRRMSDRRRGQLAAEMTDVGVVQPVVVREKPDAPGRFEILDGHHRFGIMTDGGERAADVPVVVVDVPDDNRARAFVLAAGNLRADWDQEALSAFVSGILADGAGAAWVSDLTGFTGADLPQLAGAGAEFLDDLLPEPADGTADALAEKGAAGEHTGRTPLTVWLLPDQQAAVYAAVRAAKRSAGAGTTAEALAHVCGAFAPAEPAAPERPPRARRRPAAGGAA